MVAMPIPFLHSNERILYRSRRSSLALMLGLQLGLFQGWVVSIFLAAIVLMFSEDESWLLQGIIVAICVSLLMFRQWQCWKRTIIVITSQRIIVEGYNLRLSEGNEHKRHRSTFRAAQQTIQWSTYQESIFSGSLHTWWNPNTGSLTIRHGTAEASRKVTLTLLPYALDLKHYLDKIQSLKVAKIGDSELPAFVRAKRGKRDQAVLTEV